MKYDVTLRETEVYVIEGIEADSEEEAQEKAYEMMDEEGEEKEKWWNDSNGETEVSDSEEQ